MTLVRLDDCYSWFNSPGGSAQRVDLEEAITGIIIWLVMGALVGWISDIIMGTNGQQGIILNIVVGIIGALNGGWLIGPLLGAGSINQGLSVMSFVVSLIGPISCSR